MESGWPDGIAGVGAEQVSTFVLAEAAGRSAGSMNNVTTELGDATRAAPRAPNAADAGADTNSPAGDAVHGGDDQERPGHRDDRQLLDLIHDKLVEFLDRGGFDPSDHVGLAVHRPGLLNELRGVLEKAG
jgi:hypothetical protein